MALIPADADGPAGARRAPRSGRPQPRGAAGAEAAGAAGAEPPRRGLLLRGDRRDHRLQPHQDQPLPGRGQGEVPGPARAQPGRQPLCRAAAAALGLLRRRGRRGGRGDAARAPARLRQLPGDPARLPGRAAGGGGAGADPAARPLPASTAPTTRSPAWRRASAVVAPADSALSQVAASGGTRGAGMAALAKVAAICVGTAGGAAACVGDGHGPGAAGDRLPADEDGGRASASSTRSSAPSGARRAGSTTKPRRSPSNQTPSRPQPIMSPSRRPSRSRPPLPKPPAGPPNTRPNRHRSQRPKAPARSGSTAASSGSPAGSSGRDAALGNTLRAALAILAASLLIADGAAADQASRLLPINLLVLDKDAIADGDSWHADNYFQLNWIRPPLPNRASRSRPPTTASATPPGKCSAVRAPRNTGCPVTEPRSPRSASPPPQPPASTRSISGWRAREVSEGPR